MFGAAVARVHGDAGRARTSLGAFATFAALALAPDLDVIAFRLGIPYAAPFGHRGASHALVTAVVVGALAGVVIARAWRMRAGVSIACAVVALASHGVFDMLTDGGEGVAYLWPFSTERWFFPVRPLPVAPIGARFLSLRGLVCASVELVVFAPFAWLAWRGVRSRA